MLQASSIIRDARRAAGLTQTALAERLGVPQSVVARLETPESNPTWTTVNRALAACGRSLTVTEAASTDGIDPTLITVGLTPGERLRLFEQNQASLQDFQRRIKPVDA
ncbi:MAG: helix-turn-helix transcriptional regulator [Solirubrobacterales bacterium]|nr:helix-turn-helix transcriptional regulator [Solirubrobacterales bacterium]